MKKYTLLTLLTLSMVGSISAHSQVCQSAKTNGILKSAALGFAAGFAARKAADLNLAKPDTSFLTSYTLANSCYIITEVNELGHSYPKSYCSPNCSTAKTFCSFVATNAGLLTGYITPEIMALLKHAKNEFLKHVASSLDKISK